MSDQSDYRPNNRPPPTWVELTVVSIPDETDLGVRVQTTEAGRPMYSYQLGRMRDGKFMSFIRADVVTHNTKVDIYPLETKWISALFSKADDAIYDDAQRREDLWQQSGRGGPYSSREESPGAVQNDERQFRGNDRAVGGNRR